MPDSSKSNDANRSANRPKRPKRPIRPEDKADLVLTPGGLRPRSLVHRLKPGEHVSLKDGRVRIIETATGNVVKDLGESAKPGEGDEEKPSPKASGASPGPSGPVAATPDIGWIENSQWRRGAGQPIVYFSTKWIVPPPPAVTTDNQTVFLFNGMQPDTAAHILQPVLQWGPSAAGGGNSWMITNWYADGQGGAAVIGTSLVAVNPGDELQGVMKCTSQTATGFSYTSSFVGFPGADVSVTDADELTWAYETLEAYGQAFTNPVPQCADYPDTDFTAMYEIDIKTGAPGSAGTDAAINWVAVTNFTDCGQSCQIVSNDSPGGAVYLYYRSPTQNFYFVVDKGTFGKDEVADVIAHSGGVYTAAVYLAIEGFTLEQLMIDQPSIITPAVSGAFTTFSSGVHVVPSTTYAPVYDASNLHTPQRILFPFDVTFNQFAHDNSFPASGTQGEELDATITVGGVTRNATTEMFLVAGADPYFNNVDPDQNNVFYLSQDLRVFTISPQTNPATPIDSVPFTFQGGSPTNLDSPAAYAYIQNLIGHFNGTYSDPGGPDPFKPTSNVLPGFADVYSGDSTVTPASFNPADPLNPSRNYNFALARVRLRGTSGPTGEADQVRVFFRLFTTQTFDTDYINMASAVSAGDPNITYPSLPAGSPDAPTSPLPGTDAVGTINGCSLPFSAAADLSDLASGGVNNQTIIIPSGRNSTWAYFGCYLNVYDNTVSIGGQDPQFWLAGSTHNCLVAQIAYSGTPIRNLNGVIENPENSSLLAQRNLQVTPSGNPGYPESHLIPQTFDTRPSPPPSGGTLGDYPDELMIDWRNTPRGSTADIYWPEVDAAKVVAAATKLYPSSTLAVVDSHTIRCTVGAGMTFVPIPLGGKESFAGLITVQLPNGIKAGKEFHIVIRRITSRRLGRNFGVARAGAVAPRILEWRYVVGTFQMTIPVKHEPDILPAEESLLAILKWRLTWLTPKSRWHPILLRYVHYVARRVHGFGGNPDHIRPSPLGTAGQGKPGHGDKEDEWTGKVCGIRYNRFGDFIGFDLITLAGEKRRFHGREPAIEELVRKAWRRRFLIRVFGSKHDHDWPAEIVLLRSSRKEEERRRCWGFRWLCWWRPWRRSGLDDKS